MSEAELNTQAAALASQLLQIGSLLGQVESSAAILQHLEPNVWKRIKSALELQTIQSNSSSSSTEARNAALQRWIWPELNARCPQPAKGPESVAGPDFYELLASGTFPLLSGPPPPPRPPSPPFGIDTDAIMTSATSAPMFYHQPNVYSEPYPETYFPPLPPIPPTSAPFFNETPFAAPFSTINPQLLFQPPPTSNPKTPTLPSIFTSFVAAPFPHGSGILVTTPHASWDEASTPKTASSLFGSHAGMFGALDANDLYPGNNSANPGDIYTPNAFNGALFDTPPSFEQQQLDGGLGADLARAASPLPSSVIIAISGAETPPIDARQPSHGRTRSFGSSRAEPYPTSSANATDASDDDGMPTPRRHRRGSSASRHPRSPETTSLDFANEPTNPGLGGAGGRRKSGGGSHSRNPSGQSELGVDLPLEPHQFKQSPSTGLAQLHLSPNLPSLFPSFAAATPGPAAATPVAASRSKSDGGTKKRAKRQIVIAKDADFRDNDQSIFVIHAPTKEGKVNVTPTDVQEVVLDPNQNKPGSFLFELVFNGLPYSSELHALDCDREESYLFSATSSKRPTRYHVSFSKTHPEGLVQTVDPADDITLSMPLLPMKFVHFLPGTIVVFPSHVIGSAHWWRQHRCRGRHLKGDEPDGSWTGRWDVDEPRRPSRLVEHYAECEHRRALGAHDGLGQLARAIRGVGPVKARKPKRISRGFMKDEEDDDDDEDDGDDDEG